MSLVSTTQKSGTRPGKSGRVLPVVERSEKGKRSTPNGETLNSQPSTLNTFLAEHGVVPGTLSHMPKELVSELAHQPEILKNAERLMRDARVRENLMLIEQRKMKAYSDRLEQCFVDGLGEKVASIHPEFYNSMRVFYGRDCWRDKDKREFILRKFPFLRVRCVAPKLTLRVNGMRNGATIPGARKEDFARSPQRTQSKSKSLVGLSDLGARRDTP